MGVMTIPPDMLETVERMKGAHKAIGEQADGLTARYGAKETAGALLLMSAQVARGGGLAAEEYLGMVQRMLMVMGFDCALVVDWDGDEDGDDAPPRPQERH
jgi:hypothetical protein